MNWIINKNQAVMKTSYCTYVVGKYHEKQYLIDMYVQNIPVRIPTFFKSISKAKRVCEFIEKESIEPLKDYRNEI